ncbi:MAG: cytochrome B6 [Desulfuromonas sp.]|mgnify:CR=1 FL=1|nr:MAG: cytochrome B6 [Desulfuromonas sp.]
MKDHVPSAPYFFRIVKRALIAAVVSLMALAFFIPAPLQSPADIGRVPNPSKSAWFLLWTQELVSYSSLLVYLILGLGLFFCALPWLPISPVADSARWFPKEQKWASLITLLVFVGILILTIIAHYFRGENWQLVFGF